jgi:SAM-dependent methyltransferase
MALLFVRRILHVFVEDGPRGLGAAVFRKLARPLQRLRRGKSSEPVAALAGGIPVPTHPFDLQHGTETSGLILGEKLVSGERNDLWSTAYYGISPSGFNQALSALDLDWRRFTFVDLGSGKGRALLLASRFPFRRIVGVELAPELSEVAAANILRFSASWQQCRDVEAHTGDAAEFSYPRGPIVLYLYHPFLAPVLKRCLANLSRALAAEPRELYVVYVNPVFERLMKQVPGLVRLWEREFAFSDEDALADRLGAKTDRVVVYRYLP